ncbi:RHS repeat protein [Dyella dinghuensis]|uniref:RHS repeat protein n=1 Tax=Dyella dinghuensis TaxID=1920169 RepID=A0A3S0RF40_9GAMM|nr:RHS repeat-associated core domain-containing protein [Dyella dinghuensis]RUL65784.1 RHS repeat protein [Dyella dinghuensis]
MRSVVMGTDFLARPARATWSLGSLILSFLLAFGSVMAVPVTWLGVATLTALPTVVHAQAEPPCDPADAGANDDDGDEFCNAASAGKNLGNPKNPGCDCTYPQGTSGDPIDNATGNIYIEEDDQQGGGAFPLRLTRSYNSSTASMLYMSTVSTPLGASVTNARPVISEASEIAKRSAIENVVYPVGDATPGIGIASYVYPFGIGWSFNYGSRLVFDNEQPVTSLEALRGDGQVLTFILTNGVWTPDADVNDQLTEQTDGSGNATGWTLIDGDLNTEQYDATGHLQTLTNRAGLTQTFGYNTAGQLASVTDPSGRSLQFAYNAQNQVTKVTDSAGGAYIYAYDTNGNLHSVTYPDSRVKTYAYTATSVSPYTYYLLDSVVDETNTTYASYTYTGYQSGASTSLAGGVNSIQLTVGGNSNTSTTTDALGAVRTYTSQFLVNGFRHTQVQTPCLGCATSVNTATYTYNANGYIASETNVLGDGSTPRNLTYTWDTSHNLLQTFVDGAGSPQQRTTTMTWNTALRVPLTRTVSNANNIIVRSEGWFYNAAGQTLAHCLIDPTNSADSGYVCSNTGSAPSGVRRWTYVYCTMVGGNCPLVGLLQSVTGPRTDLTQTTTYSYYTSASAVSCGTPGAACYQPGDLYQVTDPLGHTTTYLSYDADGRVITMQDSNGVYTNLAYTPRGWLASRTIRVTPANTPNSSDAITTLSYTPYGAVAGITDPDGVVVTFTYDAAHRLTAITDALGKHIQYTLDAAGNRTKEQYFNAAGTVVHSVSRNYNVLSQLTTVMDGLNNTVFSATYSDSYDGNGNLVHSVDARGFQHHQGFDALDRLISTIQNYNGSDPSTTNTTTAYGRDALDRLTAVTDPSGLSTSYIYDGLNDRTSLQSPDTGASSDTYDAAGNRLTHTDAKGITSTSTYDADNRLIGISYPDSTQNVTYYYDEADSVTGCSSSRPTDRLTRIVENGLTTIFCYGGHGNIGTLRRAASSYTDTTTYGYTLADRLSSVTNADGTLTQYTYNSNGLFESVQVTPSGATSPTTVVSSVTWMPFGPISGYVLGNGQTVTRSYDANYQLTDLTSPAFNLHVARDAMGDITAIGNASGANPATETYVYDSLYRLLSVTEANGSVLESVTYNQTGDRLTKTGFGLDAGTYTYNAGTHQLNAVGNSAFTADADGNTTGMTQAGSTYGFGYSDRNRMTVAQLGGSTIANYTYDAVGERIQKVTGTATERYDYNTSSQLLGEYGTTNRDYIWMGNIPVANVDTAGQTSTIAYVTADQLGTPRAITNSSGTTEWQNPYQGNPWNEVAPTTTGYTYNARFPGQYFDQETGLNYNGHRDYDSSTGRYIESDPLGMFGGQASTYAYAGSDPLSHIDPFGLATTIIVTYDGGIGTHAALYTDHGFENGPFIYDPAGAYPGVTPGQDVRGSGDLFTGDDANLGSYLAFQRGTGSNVTTYTFNTTPQEEAAIDANAEAEGGAFPGFCADHVSNAIRGIGPFSNLPHYYRPGGLGTALSDLPGVTTKQVP